MIGSIGVPKSYGPQYADSFGKGNYPVMHYFLLNSSLSEIDSLARNNFVHDQQYFK